MIITNQFGKHNANLTPLYRISTYLLKLRTFTLRTNVPFYASTTGVPNHELDQLLAHYIQGPSWQTGFFELGLRDRNMQVRFFLEMVFNAKICKMLLLQPAFMKCMLFAIYGPI